MFNFTIPSDGSSVSAGDFAKAAEEAAAKFREAHKDIADDGEYAQVEAAISAAKVLVKGAADNVYVTIGGFSNAPGAEKHGVSIGVYHRPAPVAIASPAEVVAQPAPYSPYSTGPKPEEIAREATATGKPIEQVAKELGAPTVTISKTDKAGVTTTVTKPTGAVQAPAIPANKANLPTTADVRTAARRSPYDAGSPTDAERAAAPLPSEGSSATTPAVATKAVPGVKATAAQQHAADVANSTNDGRTPATKKASAQVPVRVMSGTKATAPTKANAGAAQSNAQTAKPAPGPIEKQVAKDRSGK